MFIVCIYFPHGFVFYQTCIVMKMISLVENVIQEVERTQLNQAFSSKFNNHVLSGCKWRCIILITQMVSFLLNIIIIHCVSLILNLIWLGTILTRVLVWKVQVFLRIILSYISMKQTNQNVTLWFIGSKIIIDWLKGKSGVVE